MTLEQQVRAAMRNRAAVVGSVAGVALVYLGWRQLRTSSAPIVVAPSAGAPVDTGAVSQAAFSAGASAASSGFGAGASAASSGFDTGAALGQAGISLAGSVVTDLGSVAGTLAQSQAAMGSSLSGALSSAVGAITTPQQTPALPPLPVPPPGTPPAPPATPPAAQSWRLVFRSPTPVYSSPGGAQVGTAYSMSAVATAVQSGGRAWWRITSATRFVGSYVSYGVNGSFTATPA